MVESGVFLAHKSSGRPVEDPLRVMVTLEESVTDFIRAVVEATRNSDDFLCVVNKKSALNSKAPGDSAPPELNLFDVFKTLDQRPLKEQGFWNIVSKTTGVAGIAAKLSDKRSNSGRCCYYRNNVCILLSLTQFSINSLVRILCMPPPFIRSGLS